MSLQVWLPLNGNLNNQGLSDITVNNYGATVNNSGKIGQCYSFDGTNDYLSFSYNIADIVCHPWSFVCWAKFNNVTSNATLICSRKTTGKGMAIFKLGTGFRFDDGTDTTEQKNDFSSYFTCAANTWYHLVFIHTENQKKFYVNGTLIYETTTNFPLPASNSTQTVTIGGSGSNGVADGNWLNGYLNDIRFYDHALSDKEIEELSKGLVLHYKLDNIVNNNLLEFVPKTYTPANYGAYALALTELMELNQNYTIQLWDVDVSHSGKQNNELGLEVYLGGGSNLLIQFIGNQYFINGHADYLCGTFSRTSWSVSSQAQNLWLTIYNSPPSASGTKNMSIGAWKLEKGSIPTAYNNNIDNNIIWDSSGYGNHGTITGTLTPIQDTSRYNISLYTSTGNTNYITSPTMYLPGDKITMNFWFKSANKTPGSDYHMPFEGTGSSNQSYEMSIQKTGYLRGGLVIGGSRKVDNCTSTKLTNGNWHMCTMTYDGVTIKRYVDGVMEKSTAATGALVTSTQFVLGHYGSNTSYYSKETYTSDVRLYTTALTDAQIKELYNTSTTIDNKGNVYAREVVEV